MLHYNHGWMKCPGLFTAPVMIVEDYPFIPEHMNVSAFYHNDNDPASPEENNCFEDEVDGLHISPNLQALLDNNLTTTLRYQVMALQ